MAAPLGNQNAKKAKVFENALRRALARAAETVDGGLDKVADKLVTHGMAGEQWAVKEIADRLDGKVPQAVIGGGEDDPPVNLVSRIIREIVKPDASEG